jgi:hypothetical protein
MNISSVSLGDYNQNLIPPTNVQVKVMNEAQEQSRRAIELLNNSIDKLKGRAFDGLA